MADARISRQQHARAVRRALAVLTAYRERDTLGERVVHREAVTAIVEVGPVQLTYAFADLSRALVTGIESSARTLLASDPILTMALERLRLGAEPLLPCDVKLDAGSILLGLGSWAVSAED